MANEMRTFTFGGVTHPIEDASSIKSADMVGSDLQLKDADGTVRSTVAIPTGGVKYTTFKVGTNNATYGDLCYVDDAPLATAQPGEFIYVEPLYDTITAFGYWIKGQQSSYGAGLIIKGLTQAPINQPLVLLTIKNNGQTVTAQYVPTSPENTLEAMLSDRSATLLDAWKALCSWKPCHAMISDRAARIYSATNTEYAYAASAVNSNYRRIFCYSDGTYASLIPLAAEQSASTVDHCQQDYTNSSAWTDPNPCIDEPEALSVAYGSGTEMFMTALDTDGAVGELVPADGRGSDHVPDNFAIVMGHWV